MSDSGKGGFISRVIGPKRQWRQYRGRVRQLPPKHRMAVEAVERYLMHFVPVDDDSVTVEFEDLVELFERSAADGTPIREVVGEDPVGFVESFARRYSTGGYVPARARRRLAGAIARAAGEDTGQ